MPNDEQKRLTHKYWKSAIKRAVKAQPRDDWKAADARLNCEKGGGEETRDGIPEPYVNGFRLHYESSKSFLDQMDPSFKVTPTKAFLEDETAQRYAECDMAYLKYIWGEQHCQVIESQKLDSTLRFNFGVSCVIFDTKKWMPALKYLPARNTLVDPDCDGILQNAGWMGYYEDIPIEELKSQHPDLTEDELKSIYKAAKSVLKESEQGEHPLEEDDVGKKMFDVIRVFHIFAKDVAAIRVTDKLGDEPEMPAKSTLEELNLSTPRKYLKFSEGYIGPLAEREWPFDLDNDEFPMEILRFNTPGERIYGFTDYKQMQRMDNMCESVMTDIKYDSFWSSMRKFTASELNDITPEKMIAMLHDHRRAFIPEMIDANGEPKMREIELSRHNSNLANTYELLDKHRKMASGLGELLASEVREFKDVTAIAARISDANTHQRVNRRLGGPEGYEASIAADAIKLLEVAHQLVPQVSLLEIELPEMIMGEDGVPMETGATMKRFMSLPWKQAQAMMAAGEGELIKLGADAIVGPELAPYWRTSDKFPVRTFKLSTKVAVEPGSTRTVTREQQAAVLKQYLLEVFLPLYQATNRWDLYTAFAARIGRMAGIIDIEDVLPNLEEIKKFSKEQAQMQQVAQQQGAVQGAA